MLKTKNVSCDLDINSNGKRIGSLDLNYSDDQHSFSTIPIPIAVIVGKPGPTLLLCAGNHGDEYEGQVVLRQLIHQLQPEQVTGRIIILPALNYPAVKADSRISPLDDGNLNRSFPGEENSGPTQAIAHFISQKLLPLCDAGVDLHSGGRPAHYAPCSFLCTSKDPAVLEKSLAMADAFAAPFTYVIDGSDAPNGLDPTAHRAAIPFISAELYGGAGVDSQATEIGKRGIANILHHLTMTESSSSFPCEQTYLNGISGGEVLTAKFSGIFEPLHPAGATVCAGELAGRVFSLEEIDRPASEVFFNTSGVIAIKRAQAQVCAGSHLYLVLPEMSRAQILKSISLHI